MCNLGFGLSRLWWWGDRGVEELVVSTGKAEMMSVWVGWSGGW